MVKRIKILIGIILLFVAGFLREFIFESVNAKISALKLTDGNSQYELTSFLTGLNSWSPSSLYGLKFFLTFLFAFLFLALSLFLVKTIFREKEYLKITALFFGAIFALSFLIYGLGYLLGIPNKGYTISRYIIEFIESPLAVFFLLPALHLYRKNT
ncbi:MAG: hypothetical protein CL840_19920 [Crocinitomicaceae bacterium]|nr:hypothetical protein [Crocinitomicaceae bacterium]